MAKVLNDGPAMRPFTLEYGVLNARNVASIYECIESIGTGEAGFRKAFDEAWERTPAKKLLPLSRDEILAKLVTAVFAAG